MPNVIEPTFRVMPESVSERWRLLRRFTERWQDISLAAGNEVAMPPLPPNNITSQYPVSFVEWLRFCHALQLAGGNYKYLLNENLVTEVIPGHSAISLMFRGEGDCYWGVHLSDLCVDDPPVHKFVLREDAGREVFLDIGIECESITEFALRRLAYHVFPLMWMRIEAATDARVEQMKAEFECHAKLGSHQIFESPSVAAIVTRNRNLIIGMQKSPEKPNVPAIVSDVLGEDWWEDMFRPRKL